MSLSITPIQAKIELQNLLEKYDQVGGINGMTVGEMQRIQELEDYLEEVAEYELGEERFF